MNRLIIIVLLAVLVLSCVPTRQVQQAVSGQENGEQVAAAELTFNFSRQTGPASNQYAVWIEDAQGNYVKSLYASRWTANGGYSRRPTSIPLWIKQSGRPNMTSAQVDAVSGATPGNGPVMHIWDGTDTNGAAVPDGNYVMILEGTLRWENQVYYRAPIALGQSEATAQVSVEYVGGGAAAERSMISGVNVRVFR